MPRAGEIVSRVGWKIRPQDNVELEKFGVVDGKFVSSSHGSKIRLIAYLRVRVSDLEDDPRMDYAAALRTALQQQRMRGLFEGLRRASVPFSYVVLMNHKKTEREGKPLFEFDLIVGTWVDGKAKDGKVLGDEVEHKVNVLSATLSVALPTATITRLLRYDLVNYLKTLYLPGERPLAQAGPPAVGGVLCSFEEVNPAVGQQEQPPEFYVPNELESGKDGIVLGSIESAGSELHDFRLQAEDLRRHVVILGMTGSGKSTTGVSVVRQLAELGLPAMVFDWHNEYGQTVREAGGKVIAPGKDEFSLNPMEASPGVDPTEHIATVCDIFSDIYHFTHPQAYMFRNALQRRMSETAADEVANLSSLVRTIEAYPLRSAYDNETKVALLRRLVPLTQGQAGKALGGPGAFRLDELLETNVCVELGHLRDIQSRAVFADVMLKMIYEDKVRRKSALDHVTVIEEARNIAPARRLEDPPSVGERMISELRKFGEAMIFVAQFPSQIASEVVKNSGTKIVHRVAWPNDLLLIGESLGLSQKQREYLTKLRVGEAVVGVSRLQNSVLVQVRGIQSGVTSSKEPSLAAES